MKGLFLNFILVLSLAIGANAQCDPNALAQGCNSKLGVFTFIKFNGVEAKIRDHEIAILKSIESSGYDVTQQSTNLNLLDDVEITQGPLKGLKGTIVQLENLNYVQIQLESLHQSIKVKLPQHILKMQSSKN